MVREVEYGKSQKAFRRSVQGINLSAGFRRPGAAGALPRSPAQSAEGRAMGDVVSAGRAAGSPVSGRKSAGPRDREAACEDRSDGGADRSVKKNSKDISGREKRRWVSDHREQFGTLSKACKAIGLATSSFYYKLKVDPTERLKRDSDLRDLIEEIQSKFPQYGVRGVQRELQWGYGKRVNHKRIHRVMREHGLRAQIYRGFKVSTTDSNHQSRIYPNLVHGMEVSHPDQLWVADITYLKSEVRGVYFYLYLFLDVFSRKIVGWEVFDYESAEYSSQLFEEICLSNNVVNTGIVLHADNGGPMKGSTMLATMQRLGVIKSFSRAQVSDDNPYSESLFRTMKYRPGYPTKPFKDVEAAREWVQGFVQWYNTEHLQSEISFTSPESRHNGLDTEVLKKARRGV